MIKRTLYISFIIIFAFFLTSFSDSYYFKITKSFDIFSSIVREISANYVLDVDPEILIENGINGMLSTLDPYTVYYSGENQDDIDILTKGTYSGFGFSVRNIDSMLTIVDVRSGYSAKNDGMDIGDRIFKIDGNEVLFWHNSKLRDITRGEPGTKAVFTLIKSGTNDTVDVVLTRNNIELKSLAYSGLIDTNMLYIKLDRFSRSTAREVRSVIYSYKDGNNLQGIIVDVRDNPGGLLDAAIALTEIFVPKGSLIVSTKGKDTVNNKFFFYSSMDPLLPDLPLSVILNENSASASEIFAGAIQDLDRGLVVGARSFGKGLVQSVFELPYSAGIKITTSKYYTPSGRSIQRLKFADEYQKIVEADSDTTTYYTKNGRAVYELTGIEPDILTESEKSSELVKNLIRNNVIFNFVSKYYNSIDDTGFDYKLFLTYLEEIEHHQESNIFEKINELESLINKSNDTYSDILPIINDLKANVEKNDIENFSNYTEEITQEIIDEYSRRQLSDNKYYEYRLNRDKTINETLALLKSKKYQEIITNSTENKNNNH